MNKGKKKKKLPRAIAERGRCLQYQWGIQLYHVNYTTIPSTHSHKIRPQPSPIAHCFHPSKLWLTITFNMKQLKFPIKSLNRGLKIVYSTNQNIPTLVKVPVIFSYHNFASFVCYTKSSSESLYLNGTKLTNPNLYDTSYFIL